MNANLQLKSVLVAVAACISLSAIAAENMGTSSTNQAGLTPQQQEAADLKNKSKAEYNARKKVADANKDVAVADCETKGLNAKDKRDCKAAAKDAANASKAEAKQIYKEEKAGIKTKTEAGATTQ